ncbi:insulinase family protein, partial [Streptomyces sp. NPDC096080]|uniref:insulinase family protein n=1 Tax=Streptomyces sp. NPDC096080 TaxID=3156693 RepID=UPI003317DC1C
MSVTGPAAAAGIRRISLPNGLRVLLAPEAAGSCVAVAAHYRVGFRSDPLGRPGLAHLLEHLMFRRGKTDGVHPVERVGGHRNAATGPDVTDFHQVGPAEALEAMLADEAARMRDLDLDERALRAEKNVVADEIRRNVTDRPYGGFPKAVLPPLLYRTYANAHDGYGDAAALAPATVEECRAFFTRHHTPGNALLTVAGAFDPDTAARLAARHFATLPARTSVAPPDLDEPEPAAERHGSHHDPLAPLPAVSVGYRLPDPGADLPAHLAHVLLAAVLEERLRERLVAREGVAVAVTVACGLIGGPFAARHPVTLACTVTLTVGAEHRRATDAVDAELGLLARHGPSADEHLVATRRWTTSLLRGHDSLLARLRSLATFELLHGDAALHHRVPVLAAAVTPADTARAATRLRTSARAILTLPVAPPSASPTPPTEFRPVGPITCAPPADTRPVGRTEFAPPAESPPTGPNMPTPPAEPRPVDSPTPAPPADPRPVDSPTPAPPADPRPVDSPTP